MGLFFDDEPEKQVSEKTETKNVNQGFLTAAGLLILTGTLTTLGLIVKPFLSWAFTIEGRTPDQLKKQGLAIIVIFGSIFFLLYKIPSVRDFVSLSNSHTVNINNGNRILFPDRSYFEETGEVKFHIFEQVGEITYVSYTGYNEHRAQNLESNMCQLVKRGGKILLSSGHPPVQAVGFKETVSYSVHETAVEMTGLNKLLIYLANPTFIFRSKEFLSQQKFILQEEKSWNNFLHEWEKLDTIMGTEHKWFLVQAKTDEHAIICF